MEVREIAAATAGDQDFLADAVGMLENADMPAAFAGLNRAEESRGPRTENQCVKFACQE